MESRTVVGNGRVHTGTAALAVAAAVALLGCEGFGSAGYRLTVVNYRQDAIVVQGLERRLEPCSVYQETLSGPPRGTPWSVTVADLGGQIVYTTTVKGEGNGAWAPILVDVPGDPDDPCPPEVRGKYMLTVRNQLSYDIDLSLGDVQLGPVKRWGTSRFGPIAGTWESLGTDLVVSDSTGRDVGDGYTLRMSILTYRLGEVPEVEFWVKEGVTP